MLTFGTIYQVTQINGQPPKYWENFDRNRQTPKVSSPEQQSLLTQAAKVLSVANGVNGLSDVFTALKKRRRTKKRCVYCH